MLPLAEASIADKNSKAILLQHSNRRIQSKTTKYHNTRARGFKRTVNIQNNHTQHSYFILCAKALVARGRISSRMAHECTESAIRRTCITSAQMRCDNFYRMSRPFNIQSKESSTSRMIGLLYSYCSFAAVLRVAAIVYFLLFYSYATPSLHYYCYYIYVTFDFIIQQQHPRATMKFH